MNRKFSISGLLALFLVVSCESLFSMHFAARAIGSHLVTSTIVGGTIYGSSRLYGLYESQTGKDVFPRAEKWARTILTENNTKGADTVSLKMGPWSMIGDSCIKMEQADVKEIERITSLDQQFWNKNDRKKMILFERNMRHEKTHWQNKDALKGSIFFGLTASPALYCRSGIGFACGAILSAAANVSFMRYREAEAERSAYMSMSSLDALEVIKKENEQWAEQFEFNVRATMPVEKVAQFEDPERFRQFVEFVYFTSDWRHPSHRYHVQLVQDCIDKRKAEEAKLKEVIS